MGFDTIVIGAGIGGLFAAAKLARSGRKVVVLEANPHIGGTSYLFRRGRYSFPMGPLSFGFPGRVESFLEDAGVGGGIQFRRNHFQLVAPGLDIVYSQPLAALEKELGGLFPGQVEGLRQVFAELDEILGAAGPGADPSAAAEPLQAWAAESARAFLEARISDSALRNLIGSMGTQAPDMSLLNLALMWRVMSEVGIWFPSTGIHGLCRRLAAAVGFSGGQVRIGEPVARILVAGGRAAGVRTASGAELRAGHIVSNADYKKTFLELIAPDDVPPDHLAAVRDAPYTGSELCVYCGVDPGRIDFRRMRATHLFYRKDIRPETDGGTDDFDNKEVEICRFSDNAPDAVPPGRASLILRVPYPYEAAARWLSGDKKRTAGYGREKIRLAWKLIRTADSILPGLAGAVEIMNAATPLTYRDWGRRTLGSIAGWSWTPATAAAFPDQLLVRTPVEGLFAAGIYAARELFLGGVPTALFTGGLAADLILRP